MLDEIFEAVFSPLSKRMQEVLVRRFGLKNNDPQTLEAIGQKWGITRERVRQIEAAAFQILQKKGNLKTALAKFSALAKNHLEQVGSAREEEAFLKELKFVAKDEHPASLARLKFILELDKNLYRCEETDKIKAFWATNERWGKSVVSFLDQIHRELRKVNSPMPLSDAEVFAKRIAGTIEGFKNISENTLVSYFGISKLVEHNPFGEFGLTEWPTIMPKGVRDRAYQVLRTKHEPLHFKDLAKQINEHAKLAKGYHQAWQKNIGLQTVHNELIKDSRFVLVGRGMYALTEWGYQPGTVKDVLVSILQKSGKPMGREDLMSEMKQARLVKENTVVINLQDRKLFERMADGRYRLSRNSVKAEES